MSGIFMDGGSNSDGGGSSGGDGGSTFADAAHDHAADYMHSPQTDQPYADGGALGSLLSHSAQNQHGFLAHLLGLDHDGGDHAGHTHSAHSAQSGHVSQTAIWASALQHLKLSDFTHGLNFTPAMGMFFLFAGFVSWLFILYGIRHNEPLANAVLGTAPPSQGPSAYTDTRFSTKGPLSLRHFDPPTVEPAEAQTPDPNVMSGSSQSPQSPQSSQSSESSQAPYGSPVSTNFEPETSSSQPFGGAGMSMAAPVSAPLQSFQSVQAFQPMQSAQSFAPQPMIHSQRSSFGRSPVTDGNEGAYAVSRVRSADGTKLKFIVNN